MGTASNFSDVNILQKIIYKKIKESVSHLSLSILQQYMDVTISLGRFVADYNSL